MTEAIIDAADWQTFHAAIVHQLNPVLPELYKQLAQRGEADQLGAYCERYVRSMRDNCITLMNAAGIFSELRDGNTLLDCWDQLTIDKGWTVVDGARYFPPANIELRALPTTEQLATVAPELAEPVITAEAIARIAVLTADRIIEGLKPPTGDLIIERDTAGLVTGVRRSHATD
jgi:hypothetical protein